MFFVNKCLIDLHVHLDGSLPIQTVRRLMNKEGIKLDLSDRKLQMLLSVSKECKNLADYLKNFSLPLHLLQDEEAVEASVYDVLEKQKRQGIIYTELRFAPQLLTRGGHTQRDMLKAALRGLHKFMNEEKNSVKDSIQKQSNLSEDLFPALHASLLLCAMRGEDNDAENTETLNLAAEYLGKGVCGFDIAGAESLYPTRHYEWLFQNAKDMGVPFTIHAGEADGPNSIRDAIRFGASRIGHGVRAMEDPELLEELKEKQIPLELCPTSNLQTHVFDSLSEYPLRKLMRAGTCVTINTDNMTVSNTSEEKEIQQLKKEFNLTKDEINKFLLNAAGAAFASCKEKLRLKTMILKNNYIFEPGRQITVVSNMKSKIAQMQEFARVH